MVCTFFVYFGYQINNVLKLMHTRQLTGDRHHRHGIRLRVGRVAGSTVRGDSLPLQLLQGSRRARSVMVLVAETTALGLDLQLRFALVRRIVEALDFARGIARDEDVSDARAHET